MGGDTFRLSCQSGVWEDLDGGSCVFADCTLDGETVAHSASYTFYSAEEDADCASISQSRTCTDGTLDGSASFQYASCSAPDMSCLSDGEEVGGQRWFYGAYGQSCDAVCSGESLYYDEATRSYAGSDGTNANCVAVLYALGATGTTVSTYSFTAAGCGYSSSLSSRFRMTVATRSAQSSGTARRACACTDTAPPANCTLDGQTVNHGDSYTFYSAEEDTDCAGNSQSRTCNDGTLDGDANFEYASCEEPPSYACPIGSGTAMYTTPGSANFTIPTGAEDCQFSIYVLGGNGGRPDETPHVYGKGGGVKFTYTPGQAGDIDIFVGEGGSVTPLKTVIGGGGAAALRGTFYGDTIYRGQAGGGGASAIKFNNGATETLLAVAGGGGGRGEHTSGTMIVGDGGPRNNSSGVFVLAGSDGLMDQDGGKGGANNVGGAGLSYGGSGGSHGEDGHDGSGYGNPGGGGTGVPDFMISGGDGGGASASSHAAGGGGGGYGGGAGGPTDGPAGNSSGRPGGGGGGYLNYSVVGTEYEAISGPEQTTLGNGRNGAVAITWGGEEPSW
ncbi:hypothetical protein [Roseitranquillus sediminis]|uniref:hypothetical protein n=1 Tax=Roseitranquillus sediminis TaxID=2809051 RepID=UPI001D0C1BA5|nr:hypothetical protein [Roseitranquillus sediminis]MBM9593931.1 hypothetical protein [Roseitranquillus sediminis]